MNREDELIEYPTITRLSNQDKNTYRMMHINVMDLLKRIEILEQQIGEYKKSKSALEQEISANKNEINRIKNLYTGLEKRIRKYETNNQSVSAKVQKNTVKVGEIIKLGRYEGKDIEWQVLDVNQKDNSALLISKYLLFKKAYKDKREDCTWETSTLRKYLNNEFYRNSFNEEEKKKIKEEIIKNPNNRIFGTKGGNDTKDKVFLLSIDEAKSYFKSDGERAASFTDGNSKWYWLRSPGFDTLDAAYVSRDGSVSEGGYNVGHDIVGVRLAMWVNL